MLSGDGTVSCATCHRAELAFTDGSSVSSGVGGRTGLRNAPSLLDVAYRQPLFWDGGSPSLEAQVVAPLEAEDEMDADLDVVLERLSTHPEYAAMFYGAFGEPPSLPTLTRAIAAFQRTLLSRSTPYDRHAAGDGSALSPQARHGLAVFERSGCATCHPAPSFTTGRFEDNGLTRIPSDSGRARITLRPEDAYRFRVPSLRAAGRTAPYMHDGRFATLHDVVDHYDRGGEGTAGQHPLVRPLALTLEERADLVAFLQSLSE
jgi:cytochrome c peroxidase